MAAVRDDTEHLAQRVEREPANRRAPRERTIPLEVQRQVHRVEVAIGQRDVPVTPVAGVERRDVMADVVSDDDAIAKIVEEPGERLGLSQPTAALVSRHTVDSHRFRVALELEQRRVRIVQQDFPVLDSHRANRHDAVGLRVESGRFRIEHDETNRLDRRVVGPRRLERLSIPREEGRHRHRALIHPGSAANCTRRRIDRKLPLSRCRS